MQIERYQRQSQYHGGQSSYFSEKGSDPSGRQNYLFGSINNQQLSFSPLANQSSSSSVFTPPLPVTQPKTYRFVTPLSLTQLNQPTSNLGILITKLVNSMKTTPYPLRVAGSVVSMDNLPPFFPEPVTRSGQWEGLCRGLFSLTTWNGSCLGIVQVYYKKYPGLR